MLHLEFINVRQCSLRPSQRQRKPDQKIAKIRHKQLQQFNIKIQKRLKKLKFTKIRPRYFPSNKNRHACHQ